MTSAHSTPSPTTRPFIVSPPRSLNGPMVADPDRERNRRQSAVTSLELRSADEVKLSGAAPHGTDKVGLQYRVGRVRCPLPVVRGAVGVALGAVATETVGLGLPEQLRLGS